MKAKLWILISTEEEWDRVDWLLLIGSAITTTLLFGLLIFSLIYFGSGF